MIISDQGRHYLEKLRASLHGRAVMETEVLALAVRLGLRKELDAKRVQTTVAIGEMLAAFGLLTEPDLRDATGRIVFVYVRPDTNPAAPAVEADSAAEEEPALELVDTSPIPASDELVHPHLDNKQRAFLVWIRASLSPLLQGGEPAEFSLSELIERRGVFRADRVSQLAVRDLVTFLEDHGIVVTDGLNGQPVPEQRVRLAIGEPDRDPGTQIVEDMLRLAAVVVHADGHVDEREREAVLALASTPLLRSIKRGPMPLHGVVAHLLDPDTHIDVLQVARRLAQWLIPEQRSALLKRLAVIGGADDDLDPREEAVIIDIAQSFGLDAEEELEAVRQRIANAEPQAPEQSDGAVDEIMGLLGL